MLDGFAERAPPIVARFTQDSAHVEAILSKVAMNLVLEQAVKAAFLVHEAVQEPLDVKQEVFAQLDRFCPANTVLASNTSSLLFSDIAGRVTNKARVLGNQNIMPAHIIPAIEIGHCSSTPLELVQWAREFNAAIDHVAVACPERPGFRINKIRFAMLTEIYRLVGGGLVSRVDIDAAVRLSIGPRLALWGPLPTEDLIVSKQITLAVTEMLFKQTGDEIFKGRPALRKLVDGGHQGVITGQGWYQFEDSSDAVTKGPSSG